MTHSLSQEGISATVGSQPRLVVSWIDDNNRSSGIAAALGAAALFMPWARPGQVGRRRVLGWLRSAGRTWRRVRSMPDGSAVVVMVPPVFAPAVVVLSARRHTRVVFDLHSGSLNDERWLWSHWLLLRLIHQVDAVIVTNLELVEGLDLGSARVVVMVDPTDRLEPPAHVAAESGSGELPTVVFPASGAPDEPIAALIGAAAQLQGDVRVVATGRIGDAPGIEALERVGFLSASEFADLMSDADLILALTDREATNQRSAAEAVSLGKPLVCSDTAMLREVYGPAAVFAKNTPDSLAAAIRTAIRDRDRLSLGSREVAVTIAAQRNRSLATLDRLLG